MGGAKEYARQVYIHISIYILFETTWAVAPQIAPTVSGTLFGLVSSRLHTCVPLNAMQIPVTSAVTTCPRSLVDHHTKHEHLSMENIQSYPGVVCSLLGVGWSNAMENAGPATRTCAAVITQDASPQAVI